MTQSVLHYNEALVNEALGLAEGPCGLSSFFHNEKRRIMFGVNSRAQLENPNRSFGPALPKTLLGCLAALTLWISPALIEGQDPEKMQKNYDEKLAKAFAKVVPWQSSLAAAQKLAAEKNLPIIAYFTRSYAP